MVNVIYDGPNDVVVVDTWGRHFKNQVKEYPADFADELVKTRKYNRFRIVRPAEKPKRNRVSRKK